MSFFDLMTQLCFDIDLNIVKVHPNVVFSNIFCRKTCSNSFYRFVDLDSFLVLKISFSFSPQ
eukprot:TRINITY_DN3216_c0_g1_i1.p1 TRINITY_DN3216_c0_g1~~TRINITY_DN3216_c0_g1_i1.p1  ORF type:complete len:62 (+),score=15.12 TRINITY_DN3216_c0_g1_i1:129-314(+)